MQLLPNKHSKK